MNARRLVTSLLLLTVHSLCAQPGPQASATFNRYVAAVEQRLVQQHALPQPFAPGTLSPDHTAQLRQGTPLIEQITEPETVVVTPGAMLRHWRGTAFLPNTHAAAFAAMLADFKAYPRHFAPEILLASAGKPLGNVTELTLRVRQQHILTVVLDATYRVSFEPLGPHAGDELSRSSAIQEIAAAGTSHEHPLAAADEHGFLWRLNTYWTWAECDGGLVIQVEAVSLSRAIPAGLGWAVRPYVESVPRESLEFTLRSASLALND